MPVAMGELEARILYVCSTYTLPVAQGWLVAPVLCTARRRSMWARVRAVLRVVEAGNGGLPSRRRQQDPDPPAVMAVATGSLPVFQRRTLSGLFKLDPHIVSISAVFNSNLKCSSVDCPRMPVAQRSQATGRVDTHSPS
jgi:hypothetical protein